MVPPCMRRLLPLLLLAGFGCASTPTGSAPDPKEEPLPVMAHTRIQIADPRLHGASGMTTAPSGRLFAVLERDHQLFELNPSTPSSAIVGVRGISGAPAGVDLEAVAFIDDTHLAFGTETTNTQRTGDLILFAELGPDSVTISEQTLKLEYAPWGLTPERNRGVEGLCHAAGVLVAAVETVGVQDGQRFAPVATFDLLQKKWTYFRVGLTTETGKLSALTCRTSPAGVEVMAIERHYEVSRLLQFTLPRGVQGQNIAATSLADVSPIFEDGKIPNFEGLAVMSDGSLASISDNDYGGMTGPTELLILPAPNQNLGVRGQVVR